MYNMKVDPYGYIDSVKYPDKMLEYCMNCEIKLRNIIHTLYEQYNNKAICNDLKMTMDRTRFDLTCTPVPNENTAFDEWERKNEIRMFGHVISFKEYERTRQIYECKINLTYEVNLHWLRRPNQYTDYYSLRFMDMLTEENIPFTCGNIKWISDESNGQMFGERFEIDFSQQISEEFAQELSDEFKRLNDY